MTKQALRDLMDAFLAGVELQQSRLPSKPIERWRGPTIIRNHAGRCVYCDAQVACPNAGKEFSEGLPLVVDHLLPMQLGSPHEEANLVASCPVCASSKGNLDWLSWGFASSPVAALELRARRLQVLAVSANHLVRDGAKAKTRLTVEKILRARWAHPRTNVHAALTVQGGLLSWGRRARPTKEMTGYLAGLGARQWQGHGEVWHLAASDFHNAVWFVIDRNCWLQRVDLGEALPDPTPQGEQDGRWHESYTDIGDIHRRRHKLPSRRPANRNLPMDPRQREHQALTVALRTGAPVDWDWLESNRGADEVWTAKRQAKWDRIWATRRS